MSSFNVNKEEPKINEFDEILKAHNDRKKYIVIKCLCVHVNYNMSV